MSLFLYFVLNVTLQSCSSEIVPNSGVLTPLIEPRFCSEVDRTELFSKIEILSMLSTKGTILDY